jgi:hypothetical protein
MQENSGKFEQHHRVFRSHVSSFAGSSECKGNLALSSGPSPPRIRFSEAGFESDASRATTLRDSSKHPAQASLRTAR